MTAWHAGSTYMTATVSQVNPAIETPTQAAAASRELSSSAMREDGWPAQPLLDPFAMRPVVVNCESLDR